jgi:hypothetical protein
MSELARQRDEELEREELAGANEPSDDAEWSVDFTEFDQEHADPGDPLDELEAEEADDARRSPNDEQKHDVDLRAERALGRELGLGVAVRPALSVRLSGLSELSSGTGTSRASVVHLQVLEPYAHGRIKREARQFLCRKSTGWDVSPYPLDVPVSCPKCRAILARVAPSETTPQRR